MKRPLPPGATPADLEAAALVRQRVAALLRELAEIEGGISLRDLWVVLTCVRIKVVVLLGSTLLALLGGAFTLGTYSHVFTAPAPAAPQTTPAGPSAGAPTLPDTAARNAYDAAKYLVAIPTWIERGDDNAGGDSSRYSTGWQRASLSVDELVIRLRKCGVPEPELLVAPLRGAIKAKNKERALQSQKDLKVILDKRFEP